MKQRELISLEGLRLDGRRPLELRHVAFSMSVSSKVNGSATCEMGCTKVIALVDGPKQLQQKDESSGKINCSIFMTNFATAQHKDNPKRQIKLRDTAQVIKDVFENIVSLELYNKSQIDVHIIVLQNDGAYKAAAINATTLALVDAGISMKDLLLSSTAGFVQSKCCLDLLYAEEKQDKTSVIVAYVPTKRKLAHVSATSPKMSTISVSESISTAIKGCEELYGKMKAHIKEYMSLKYHT